jgi:hypothetical protein
LQGHAEYPSEFTLGEPAIVSDQLQAMTESNVIYIRPTLEDAFADAPADSQSHDGGSLALRSSPGATAVSLFASDAN